MMNHPLLLSKEILPPQRQRDDVGNINIFNPALISPPSGEFCFAYRVVDAENVRRRIGICKLDATLKPIANSSVPFSDFLDFHGEQHFSRRATNWFADPRLFWWKNRLYIYWNTGSHGPMNYQFIQEIDSDSLWPINTACTLGRLEGRRPAEKNWGLFEYEDESYAIYTLHPLVVLKLKNRTDFAFIFSTRSTVSRNCRDFIRRFGEPHGGTPPLKIGEKLYRVFHAKTRKILRYRYVAGLLIAQSHPPFNPVAFTKKPLPLVNPHGRRFIYLRLNEAVSEMVHPTGIAQDNNALLISYAINDELSAINRQTIQSIENLATAIQIAPETSDRLHHLKAKTHASISKWILKRIVAYRRRKLRSM